MERIVHSPIDAEELVRSVSHAGAGAVLTFAGTVRDTHVGRQVLGIDYHAYEAMAAKEILRLEADVVERWPEVRVAVVHRIGHLGLGEVSVLIAVSAPHRREGFEALRFAIDSLKERVPIWKKEMYTDGEAWIEGS